MSNDLAKFIERLGQDPALQERLKAATDQESTAKLAVQLGAELGYSFTPEEVMAVAQQGELTEAELEQVTGGIIIVNGYDFNIGFSSLQSQLTTRGGIPPEMGTIPGPLP